MCVCFSLQGKYVNGWFIYFVSSVFARGKYSHQRHYICIIIDRQHSAWLCMVQTRVSSVYHARAYGYDDNTYTWFFSFFWTMIFSHACWSVHAVYQCLIFAVSIPLTWIHYFAGKAGVSITPALGARSLLYGTGRSSFVGMALQVTQEAFLHLSLH